MKIRDAENRNIDLFAQRIWSAYHDVALRFGLTPHNAHKHPSNGTDTWVWEAKPNHSTTSLLRSPFSRAGE
ncbi:MAG: hypothetical protein LJE94_02045 [Deltaproteobacteria bacterium]|nr:hypothetical protein [Deltaproteobacteria bacterium]